ncbi:hypothetical protein [Legionella wadsworthii]|nr:hypothetical protein [Legionella wadsworthii]
MKKGKEKQEHPEKKDIKNVCKVSPKANSTEEVCDKVNKAQQEKHNK